ncbi:MAG TPA: hypothetical protein VGN63_19530 [Flavisolibacter sp.]|jgi:hypothetical protein|nr:hypothetical protein [Flavisolibacter sp.]
MNKSDTLKAEIGTILSKDTTAFSKTMAKGQETIIPAYEAAKQAYNSLGLSRPFSQDLLNEMLHSGIEKIIQEFKKMAEKDTATFRSPVVVNQMLSQVDEYIKPLRESIKNISKAINDAFNQTGYKFSSDEISYVDGQFSIDSEKIKEFYTRRIETQTQADVYNKLLELGSVYNEVVELLKTSTIPGGITGTVAPLMRLFFTHPVLEGNSLTLQYSDKIEFKPDALVRINTN